MKTTYRILELIGLGLLIYALYEVVGGYLRRGASPMQQFGEAVGQSDGGRQGVGGARLTGGGEGEANASLDRTGMSTTERVGRGVRRPE